MINRTIRVQADLRWPRGTGIGAVKDAIMEHIPQGIVVDKLDIPCRIGNPLSPGAISVARLVQPRANIFWSPGFVPPLIKQGSAIVTVHDLTHLHYYTAYHAAYYNMVFRPLYRECSAIVCVSEYTKAEFLGWSGIPESRVSVIYNGVREGFFRASPMRVSTEQPYIFYPGNRRKYKNIFMMLKSYAASGLPDAGVGFFLTGEMDASIAESVRSLGIESKVRCLGQLSEEALISWYAGATLIAFASLYEGFGLPILEGMAAGVPVLTSNVSSMPEISGGAAYLVDPLSADDLSGAMEKLVFDEELRARLIGAGRARAARFRWSETAKKLWELVQEHAAE